MSPLIESVTEALDQLLVSHQRLVEAFYEENQIFLSQQRIAKMKLVIDRERQRIAQLREVLHRRREQAKIRRQN